MPDQNNGTIGNFIKGHWGKIISILFISGGLWANVQLTVSDNSKEIYRNSLNISGIKDDVQDFRVVDAKILEQLKYITQMIKDLKPTHK